MTTPTQIPPSEWKGVVAKYQGADPVRSLWQLGSTLTLLVLSLGLMHWALERNVWLTVGLAPGRVVDLGVWAGAPPPPSQDRGVGGWGPPTHTPRDWGGGGCTPTLGSWGGGGAFSFSSRDLGAPPPAPQHPGVGVGHPHSHPKILGWRWGHPHPHLRILGWGWASTRTPTPGVGIARNPSDDLLAPPYADGAPFERCAENQLAQPVETCVPSTAEGRVNGFL